MEPIRKCRTGISGLDKILDGGLPEGRPTLVCGGPGCGKTLLSIEFLSRGALQFNEPGLFVSFEETREDIETNFISCGFGFAEALTAQTVQIDSIPMSKDLSVESGEFTLDALLIRIKKMIEANRIKRLVLDSLCSLFERFSNTAHLRFEYSRIFQFVKDMGVTAIITSERSESMYASSKLEEYQSDCVIYLDHRISNQISKRRLRVVKYRGSSHGADEYPFMISSNGIYMMPITTLELSSPIHTDFVSSGIEGLDLILDGKGWYRGSTVLISGGPGTGKSTIGATFAQTTCKAGGRSMILSFEESSGQIVRNMRSVNVELQTHLNKEILSIEPIRPGRLGLEEHLVRIHTIIDKFKPDTVVLDPVTSFSAIGNRLEVQSMLTRLLDYFKFKGISTILTSLTPGRGSEYESETEVSSIVDVWIVLRFQEIKGERQRQIFVHKARGIAHSHKTYALDFSSNGIRVKPFTDPVSEEGARK